MLKLCLFFYWTLNQSQLKANHCRSKLLLGTDCKLWWTSVILRCRLLDLANNYNVAPKRDVNVGL